MVRCCWAAADVFLSLVDNPQETFGLAPVEAMAAGLPVVVSDWDGYRYTVTDGVEGYRVPTLSPPSSLQGEELASQHDHGMLSYQNYVGSFAQHVAVDIDSAAAALVRLASDPDLRLRMGEAGRRTVQARFNWPVVARQHHDLYAELRDLRRSSMVSHSSHSQHPLRGDPFRVFSHFATSCLGPETYLSLSMPLSQLEHDLNNLTTLDCVYGDLHAPPADVQRLVLLIDREAPNSCNLFRLLSNWPPERHDSLCLSITWLAKLGFIHWH